MAHAQPASSLQIFRQCSAYTNPLDFCDNQCVDSHDKDWSMIFFRAKLICSVVANVSAYSGQPFRADGRFQDVVIVDYYKGPKLDSDSDE